MSFKGVRFGQAPTDQLRWEPPVPFISGSAHNATILAPPCVQQFSYAASAFTQFLFNNPPVAESEDCLFLNVWAPSTNIREKKPVFFWLFGGGLMFGTVSLAAYDGVSLAANQDMVVVTVNYRTNIFGFPSSRDLPIAQNNLGLLDQELALKWVQLNIGQFGGDPSKVTIIGQSAGAGSVGYALLKDRVNPPFRAGVLLSGVPTAFPAFPPFGSFDDFAGAFQQPLFEISRTVHSVAPSTLLSTSEWKSSSFPVRFAYEMKRYDIPNPLVRVRAGNIAKVPLIVGNTENDGSVFTMGSTNITAFLDAILPGNTISPAFLRSLYPDQNDSVVIADADRDFVFRCPDELLSAVFADLQLFPGPGAWHSSEILSLFGTFNRTTAAEATWSHTFQTSVANFIKDPKKSPATNWPEYVPGTKTFAKLAYNGNVEPNNFVVPVESSLLDGPCDALWDQFMRTNF
ncbi:Alpha/Beta hydrolase protein [Mycena metata]|uniref:Carboxylic ester hydrolase n=1 Tax=Mycena metata TaxID=1033252 RepID=A0AAD7J297_9AGAR|nr:Alpha/Beta hydrolase protein [Mycena metata]